MDQRMEPKFGTDNSTMCPILETPEPEAVSETQRGER